jgi:hypothetical protein
MLAFPSQSRRLPVDAASVLWLIARLAALVSVVLVATAIALSGYKGDAYIYWQASHLPANLYSGTWNADAFSFVYPPLFAQLLVPLGLLPYPIFFALWVSLETAALLWLAGPIIAFALILPYEPVQHELLTGNINLMLATGVVLAMKHPAWWAFPILTKLTPGVGLLYAALRRDWRPVIVSIGLTAALVAASVALGPSPWSEWIGRLGANLSQAANPDEILPLPARLAFATSVITYGAWKGWTWTVVLGSGLALPNFVPMDLAFFVALVPFLPRRARAARSR